MGPTEHRVPWHITDASAPRLTSNCCPLRICSGLRKQDAINTAMGSITKMKGVNARIMSGNPLRLQLQSFACPQKCAIKRDSWQERALRKLIRRKRKAPERHDMCSTGNLLADFGGVSA